MLTTNNNDILFDDLEIITSTAGQSVNAPVLYNDCDNRHEAAVKENISADCNDSGYREILNQYGDCTNN